MSVSVIQANGTMRKKRRDRKSSNPESRSKKRVIKKPDNVKNKAMPIGPAISFSFHDLGPSGRRWAAKTNKMLMPRQPSSTARWSADVPEVDMGFAIDLLTTAAALQTA